MMQLQNCGETCYYFYFDIILFRVRYHVARQKQMLLRFLRYFKCKCKFMVMARETIKH